jgi:putative membrane protein
MQKTQRPNGHLIYVSLFEKRFILLADSGISAIIPNSTWKNITDALAQNIKKGNLTDGMCEAIDACGKILSKHFPKERDDRDELKNIIVEK